MKEALDRERIGGVSKGALPFFIERGKTLGMGGKPLRFTIMETTAKSI